MTKQAVLTPQAFRSALGTFTTGVTIITTVDEEDNPVGLTVNSFNSVSLDPPLVLWSLAKNSLSQSSFKKCLHWNVHVLSTDQESLSGKFATRGEDKFTGITLDEGISKAPLLQNCTARFQCRTASTYDGGDHIIFIGEVLAYDQSERPPLVFQRGQYAIAALKPREEVQLAASPPPECSYTEDLLGYLLGRAHYQMLFALKKLLDTQTLDELSFFILSVLSINDNLSIDKINKYISYTGKIADEEFMQELESQQLVAKESIQKESRYVLTAEGREVSLQQIALAKAVEEDLTDRLGEGDTQALKLLLKRLRSSTDPGLPDLWATE